MKTKIASLILLSGMALSACSSEPKETTTTPTPAPAAPVEAKVTEWDFNARYLVPLNTGDAERGETAVIDAANAEKTNVAELKPVMTKVLTDLQAGKLASHPAEGDSDSENNPATYFGRKSQAIGKSGAKVALKTISKNFEIHMKGHAKDGHSTLTLESIVVIHSPGGDSPDFTMVKLLPADLGTYMVGDKTLQAYLEGMAFESYVLEVKTADKDVKISDMAQVADLEAKVNSGDLSGL